jgi:hypothetical protein
MGLWSSTPPPSPAHSDMFGDNEWRYFVGDIVPDLGMTMSKDFPSWASPDRTSLYNLLVQVGPVCVWIVSGAVLSLCACACERKVPTLRRANPFCSEEIGLIPLASQEHRVSLSTR